MRGIMEMRLNTSKLECIQNAFEWDLGANERCRALGWNKKDKILVNNLT